MTKQCIDARFPTAESLERFDGRARTADRQDLVKEAFANGGIELIASLFEGRIGVS